MPKRPLPALPRREGQGRHRPDDDRRVDDRRRPTAPPVVRQPARRRRRHRAVDPAAGRPDARARRGGDDPAHPPRPAHRWDDGDWLPASRRRRVREPAHRALPEGDRGLAISTASSRDFADGGPALQGGRPRRHRDRGLRPPDRPVLVAARPTSGRTEYGGSLENRMRFSIEVLEAIRGRGRRRLHRRHPDEPSTRTCRAA